MLSASELDSARAAQQRSAAQVTELKATLLALRRGTRAEEIEQARAALATAEAALRAEELSDRRLAIRTPMAGIVEALPYRIGERPPVGAPIVVMLDNASAFARVYMPEPRKAAMRPGTSVTARIDGVDAPIQGSVRYVAAQSAFTPYYALTQRDRGRLAYLAEIDLDHAATRNLPAGIPLEIDVSSVVP